MGILSIKWHIASQEIPIITIVKVRSNSANNCGEGFRMIDSITTYSYPNARPIVFPSVYKEKKCLPERKYIELCRNLTY